MSTFYALRYVPGIALKDRKHADTLGRFETFAEADDARYLKPSAVADRLEVVVRSDEA